MTGAASTREALDKRAGGPQTAFPGNGRQRVVIEDIQPMLEAGAYAVKRIVGDRVTVSADLIVDGHDLVAGELLLRRPRAPGDARAEETLALESLDNDRFAASFVVDAPGLYEFTLCAWVDHFASYRRGLSRKVEARQDIDVDLLVGAELVSAAESKTGHPIGACRVMCW